jgi:hypothetical protein
MKGEKRVADASERKDYTFARLKKKLEEQLAERTKRPAAPVEKPIEWSRRAGEMCCGVE